MSVQSSYPVVPGKAPVSEVGSDVRRSPRRSTLARVKVFEGPSLGASAVASDVSASGAFIRTATRVEVGSRLRLSLTIPTQDQPIEVTARVAHVHNAGVGVSFEGISSRNRSLLLSHAGFAEMDQAIVRLQENLGDLMPGNLLPLADSDEIDSILRRAVEHRLTTVAVPARPGFSALRCKFDHFFENPETGDRHIRISGFDRSDSCSAIYLAFSEGPLHYAFEGLVSRNDQGNDTRTLLIPPRLYVTERRTNSRASAPKSWLEFWSPSHDQEKLRLPVLDLGESGASIEVPKEALILIGSQLPSFTLISEGERTEIDGGLVRHVRRSSDEKRRVGIQFAHAASARSTFESIRPRSVESSRVDSIRRAVGVTIGKLTRFLRPGKESRSNGVEVVRYRNALGNTVAGIVDANFDTDDPAIHPDVAVVIAPALLKRKEVFGLLARTILDDLSRDGHKAVLLRFDYCHIVGESTMDPELEAAGCPYLNWDLSQMVADIAASKKYLETRFRPKKRVLISFSFAAIGARQVVREAKDNPIDHWIAPFGCPDLQDMLRNYLAGLDLFPLYERGEGPELIHVHGRPMRGENYCMGAVRDGLAYLDQARKDIEQIETPITWILGTYDHWVTRSRVKAMLEAPGAGAREVFECATGHVLKEGQQAIEVFKLISESISKHIFGNDRAAAEPNLARFTTQSQAEWARVKRQKLDDAGTFWREHLFGSNEGEIGYDVILDHPDYVSFLHRQAELLNPREGHAIADFGCGTGNLLVSMITACGAGQPSRIVLADLVPEALERSEEKLLDYYRALNVAPPEYEKVQVDLEISKLGAIRDFLNGKVYGVEGLVGRIEGLNAMTANKVARSYGKELHEILRGARTTSQQIQALVKDLEPSEVEVIEELGRASRFVLGQLNTADLRSGIREAASAADLRFEHLNFNDSKPTFKLPFDSESFDRIGCSLVLSYLTDPVIALREMHRLLKPGGVLVASSLLPNWDPSKLYAEEAEIVSRGDDEPTTRHKLEALREFANMVSRLIELEEDGRFCFFSPDQFRGLALDAGFRSVNLFESLGRPSAAIIVRAEK